MKTPTLGRKALFFLYWCEAGWVWEQNQEENKQSNRKARSTTPLILIQSHSFRRRVVPFPFFFFFFFTITRFPKYLVKNYLVIFAAYIFEITYKGKVSYTDSVRTKKYFLRVFLSNHLKKCMVDIIIVYFLKWNYKDKPHSIRTESVQIAWLNI